MKTPGAKVSGRCLKILLSSIWDGSVWTRGGWNASGTTTLTAGNAKLTLILLFRTTPMIHLAKNLSLCWIFRNYFREFKEEMQFLLIQIGRRSLRARHVVCCRLETESVYQSNESEPWFRSQCLNEKTSLDVNLWNTNPHIKDVHFWRLMENSGGSWSTVSTMYGVTGVDKFWKWEHKSEDLPLRLSACLLASFSSYFWFHPFCLVQPLYF